MKQLKDLTKKEYESLDKIDMLEILYPEATGEYYNDCQPECNDESKFKVGDWVHTGYKFLPFGKIKRFIDIAHVEVVCAQGSGTMVTVDKCRLATSEEVESHLIKEAKRRYPIGTKFYSLYDESEHNEITTNDFFLHPSGVLVNKGSDKDVYFSKYNRWAEIIKE